MVLRQCADPQDAECKGADRQRAEFREKIQGANPSRCRTNILLNLFGSIGYCP
jgi:hypothetical protein